MKAAARNRHSDKPNIVQLSSPVNTGTLGEIYDAVRHKPGNAIVRAGKDPADQWYVYMPKKENKIAAKTYKAASIQRHRQAMADLLLQSSDAFNNQEWMGREQRKTIMDLRREVFKKNLKHTDFHAKEVAASLKPLSNQVRTRKRLEKTSALKSAVSPKLKNRKDYLNLFLKMSDSDLQIMRQALFPAAKAISFEEQKLILRSIFSLISSCLKKGDGPHTLADLVRHSPHKDLLLKFATAWTDHLDRSTLSRQANLLVVFSWQKTMTAICATITEAAAGNSGDVVALTSPDRSKILQRKFDKSRTAMDGTTPESPTKFPSLPATPVPSPVSLTGQRDASPGESATLVAAGKFRPLSGPGDGAQHVGISPEVTALPTSAVSLPDMGDAETNSTDLQVSGENGSPRL